MRMIGPQKSRNFARGRKSPGEWSWPKCGGVILAPYPYCPGRSAGGSALSLNGGSSFCRRGKIIVEVGNDSSQRGGGSAGAIAAIPGRA